MMALATILTFGGCMLATNSGPNGSRVGIAITVLGIFVAWGVALTGGAA